ncbi:hypothetical protein, partial [uncultured Ruminococcus sp.]|uniref:hypothetical protein n=1 Tax=uncultured Ruminococcus sp. TaxID=165186 RepID=UPI0025FC8BE8
STFPTFSTVSTNKVINFSTNLSTDFYRLFFTFPVISSIIRRLVSAFFCLMNETDQAYFRIWPALSGEVR